MKKHLFIILLLAVTIASLTGCKTPATKTDPSKISVVTTIFPEYDWVREITKGSDSISVTMLMDKGIDLHSFQPSADEIVKVASCDLFIYVGGESDHWVHDALAEAVNKDMIVINLLDMLGDSVKEEELVEGMEAEEEELDEDMGSEEDEPEYDEHVWLSLRNAKVLVQGIADELIRLDGAHASLYSSNASEYIGKLDSLDGKYRDTVAEAGLKTVLFGDRFPFRYLTDDYGLSYYAAFVGCSAESEASFETITFLSGKVDELGLPAILQIESADGKIAETIRENTKTKDQDILTMDSMQSVTAKDVTGGETYLGIMEKNLDILKRSLK